MRRRRDGGWSGRVIAAVRGHLYAPHEGEREREEAARGVGSGRLVAEAMSMGGWGGLGYEG